MLPAKPTDTIIIKEIDYSFLQGDLIGQKTNSLETSM